MDCSVPSEASIVDQLMYLSLAKVGGLFNKIRDIALVCHIADDGYGLVRCKAVDLIDDF